MAIPSVFGGGVKTTETKKPFEKKTLEPKKDLDTRQSAPIQKKIEEPKKDFGALKNVFEKSKPVEKDDKPIRPNTAVNKKTEQV